MAPKVTHYEQLSENIVRAIFTFDSGINGQRKEFAGTAFFLNAYKSNNASGGKCYLITNRHNVDYSLHEDGNPKKFRLTSILISRRSRLDGQPHTITEAPIDQKAEILVDKNMYNDIALIEALFDYSGTTPPKYTRHNFYLNMVVPESIFDVLPPLTTLNFVGYPGALWDTKNHTPIARQATVSSLPHFDYPIPNQQDAKRVLVSGLSLHGSSGSPVFLSDSGFLVGVMAGHFPGQGNNLNSWVLENTQLDSGSTLASAAHSGLSDFIKATVIYDILSSPQTIKWGPANWNNISMDWEP